MFTDQQNSALKAIYDWQKNGGQQIFRLFGYAGTGKTTLAKEISDNIGGKVCFATYTGKASHVLKTKGIDNATTIHSLIYSPKSKSLRKLEEFEEKLKTLRNIGLQKSKEYIDLEIKIETEIKKINSPEFSLNSDSDINGCSLVVIDECSMVDKIIGEDLLKFGKPILVLGDPAQLPPPTGAGFFINQEPDFMLTEIHRQARENPIIRIATDIREGRGIIHGDYGDVKIINRSKLNPEDVIGYDQVLVGKNITRKLYNGRIRQLLKREGVYPVPDEKLVCLRNNHATGLTNGSMWTSEVVLNVEDEKILMEIRSLDNVDNYMSVSAHVHHFDGTEKDLHPKQKHKADEFYFGYALTTHKSQGSQWDNVMVFDESGCFNSNADKWLYTAITRAAKKLIVVKS